jgi:cellulose synthase/poly-beta-1,6-N-acetylglucosamine synthase-like glycosyltransferase
MFETVAEYSLIVIVILYLLSMVIIFLYAATQFQLIWAYFIQRDRSEKELSEVKPDDLLSLPFVTVQLPVYNEKFVIERLIDQVCRMNYPADKLEVQVLDDSDDETSDLAAGRIAWWQTQGIAIYHVRRPERSGFKAGALQYGLQMAKGEYLAIFDADFLPENDFLLRMLPSFRKEEVGAVQARWSHLNRDSNLLTGLQAMALDYHFSIEQQGRSALGVYINFNGTAGIWRKKCIEDSGGWRADTLTEDLDLSYRAQLRGWIIRYKENISTAAELPPYVSALKSQYYRWNKGGAEVALKVLPSIWRAKIPFRIKWHSTWHLMNSSVFIAVATMLILSVPVILSHDSFEWIPGLLQYSSIFILPSIILMSGYFISFKKYATRPVWQFIIFFPVFMAFYMGFSWHNGKAVWEGWSGIRTPFIRTPKAGEGSSFFSLSEMKPYFQSGSNLPELLLSVYFFKGALMGLLTGIWYMVPFHLLLCAGFSYLFFAELIYSKKQFLSLDDNL